MEKEPSVTSRSWSYADLRNRTQRDAMPIKYVRTAAAARVLILFKRRPYSSVTSCIIPVVLHSLHISFFFAVAKFCI